MSRNKQAILNLAIVAAIGFWASLPIKPVVAQSAGDWSCSLDNLGATLTLCERAPTSSTYGSRLYITDILAQSTTATGGQFILRYGTGTNCGTGTASLLPSAASVVRFGYPGNASAPFAHTFKTPVAVPAGNDLCVLAVGTNTVTIHMLGTIKP